MKYGMNMLLWTTEVNESHFGILESLKKMGYDGVELPIFEINAAKFSAVGKKTKELGLGTTAVTVCGPDNNPASPTASIRQAGTDYLKQAVDMVHLAGGTHLVGPFHSAIGVFSGSSPTKDERKWSQDTLASVGDHAKAAGVTMVVEYLNRFECYLLNCAADAAEFVKQINHPNIRTMYDTFHANIEEKCQATAIRTMAPVMAHVHISENDRSTPGQGHVDFDTAFKVLKEVKYDGWLTVEAFGLALPAIAAATKIWRRMFTDELRLAEDSLMFMKKHMAE